MDKNGNYVLSRATKDELAAATASRRLHEVDVDRLQGEAEKKDEEIRSLQGRMFIICATTLFELVYLSIIALSQYTNHPLTKREI